MKVQWQVKTYAAAWEAVRLCLGESAAELLRQGFC